MVIYGEYLFLENFITGLVILCFTAATAGEKIRAVRIAAGAVFCGIYAFSMFAATPVILSIAGRIVFAAAVCCVSFGFRSCRRLLLNGILFLAVTFFYGGITLALLSIFQWEGAAGSRGVYMPFGSYVTVMAAATAAALFLQLMASLIKERRRESRSFARVSLAMGDICWEMDGFIDSGNFLKDPFSGKPAAVVSCSVMEKILADCEDRDRRYIAIPYKSVGTEKGVMDGYRIDSLTIDEKTVKKPVLAVCRDEEFFTGEQERRQILLPESMLERGIYADLKDNQGIFTKTLQNTGKKHFLHRGQRCSSTAPFKGRGAEDAAVLCAGESGGQSSAHRA